jgi:hypothetical protein
MQIAQTRIQLNGGPAVSAYGAAQFALTIKGTEELATRTHRLNLKLRSVLLLIQKGGAATIDALAQNSILPREEIILCLRGLVNDHFIALEGAGPNGPSTISAFVRNSGPATISGAPRTAGPATVNGAPRTAGPATVNGTTRPLAERAPAPAAPQISLSIDANASPSQARFLLCDFCLDIFGMAAQPMIDAVNDTHTIPEVQRALENIARQVKAQHPDELELLAEKVREINGVRS